MNSIKQIKPVAAKRLAKKGNRLRLVGVGILLTFSVMLPLLLSANLSVILLGEAEMEPIQTFLFFGAILALILLGTAPAVSALYGIAYRGYERARDGMSASARMSELRYGQCLASGLLLILRPLGVVALFVGAYALASLGAFLLYFPLACVAIALSVLWMWATSGAFLLPYYVSRGETVRSALRASRRAMKGNRRLYGAYMLSFLGWVLLSLLTVGVLLLLYVLPLMLFTYFTLADRMDRSGGKQRSEDESR
ncbi:MAG: hypothetical protein E7668_02580 [Ruminococcaceae bacterium]|nr:hypothetical protein [Oscillospiraceae bacterium]